SPRVTKTSQPSRAQRSGLAIISRKYLSHFALSSSAFAGSRKCKSTPCGNDFAFTRAGKKSRSRKMSCASVSMNSKKRIAACGWVREDGLEGEDRGGGVGGGARNRDPLETRHAGRDDEPVDRRTAFVQLLGLVRVGREHERNFSADHEIDQQSVALAHG